MHAAVSFSGLIMVYFDVLSDYLPTACNIIEILTLPMHAAGIPWH